MTRRDKILLIDDEQIWRNHIKEVLEKTGYYVKTADSGDMAVELLKESDFDVIITDIRMESEFRGIEVLEYVKEKSPITPVIMLTAYGTVDTVKDSYKKNAFDFVEKGGKSSTNKKLREKIAEALKQREIDEKKSFDEMVLHKYPSFLSEIYYELKYDLEPVEKFKRQIDLFETILKFFSIVVISEYLSGEKRILDFDSQVLAERIFTRGMGDWFQMSLELYKIKKEFPDHFFIDRFSNFFKGKNRNLMAAFIEIRDTKWGHGSKLPAIDCDGLIKECNDIIHSLLEDLNFLTSFLLCRLINLRVIKNQYIYKLIDCAGSNPKLFPSEKTFKSILPCEEMILLNLPDENYQSLHPFIVLDKCEQCGQPEIFVFSRYYKNEIHYLSYKTGHQFSTGIYNDTFFKLIGEPILESIRKSQPD